MLLVFLYFHLLDMCRAVSFAAQSHGLYKTHAHRKHSLLSVLIGDGLSLSMIHIAELIVELILNF